MVKKRIDPCPVCGNGEIEREAFPECLGRETRICKFCKTILSIPGDLKKDIVAIVSQVGGGPPMPMKDKKVISSDSRLCCFNR
jgi:hypothetical protein